MPETEKENKPQTDAQKKRRWQNTRRMAWLAAISGCLLFPALVAATDSDNLAQAAMPFYLFTGSVVGVYIGFSTAEDKWRKQ